ncbi:MAG: hypothetical protein H6540_02280 [Bacteroidales bacterium]|nr:hypothetical protein [Bacteroidales bacterium]
MLLALFVISLVSSTALGFAYEFTKEPIRMVEINKTNAAIQKLWFPAFDDTTSRATEVFKVKSDMTARSFTPAKQNGEPVGTAVETYTKKGLQRTYQTHGWFWHWLEALSIFRFWEHQKRLDWGRKSKIKSNSACSSRKIRQTSN